MPKSLEYKGHGEEVMKSMEKTYGNDKKAKEVYYSTMNKNPAMKAKSGAMDKLRKSK